MRRDAPLSLRARLAFGAAIAAFFLGAAHLVSGEASPKPSEASGSAPPKWAALLDALPGDP